MAMGRPEDWNDVDNASDGGGGGGDTWEFYFTKDEWENGTIKRIMFIEALPWMVTEHELVSLTGNHENVVCPVANKLGDECAVCGLMGDKEYQRELGVTPDRLVDRYGNKAGLWGKTAGYYTIVDMGEVVYAEDGEKKVKPYGGQYGFQRRIIRLKRGSDKHPGPLVTVRQLASKVGGEDPNVGVKGLVVDVARVGNMAPSTGNQFNIVKRVPEKDWDAYFSEMGCADVGEVNTEEVDFHAHVRILKSDAIDRIVRDNVGAFGGHGGRGNGGRSGGGNGGGTRTSGAGFDGGRGPASGGGSAGNSFSDDEIPF